MSRLSVKCKLFLKITVPVIQRKYSVARNEIFWFDVQSTRAKNISSKNLLTQELLNNVLYENEHILAINKPGGVPLYANEECTKNISISSVLSKLAEAKSSKNFYITKPMHPLYSGVIILTKNIEADKKLHEAFLNALKKEKYLFTDVAITLGSPKETQGTIKGQKISDIIQQQFPKSVNKKIFHGKTKFKVLAQGKNSAFMELKTNGGVREQNVIIMTENLTPILGDHIFSHCIGYIKNIPFILPKDSDIETNVPQNLPYNLRTELNILNNTQELPLYMHRFSISIPEIPDLNIPENILITAPCPKYFQRTMEILGLQNDTVFQ